ncbi:hypothetical protein HELRODRAFT_110752 [Helobdella robusta]|uniref:GAR domain-containing protein n=1 Tax=Helobdella robusta TaxID=6412 RepID=T1EF51_HELRO|nr:hypothetical protein HELRODRAFT_110752 [Helobdella robusta]ESO07274.1 hypothetical protein HELRODRAFT_110752 [Helobdella robusta]
MLKFQCRPGDISGAFDALDEQKTGRVHHKDFMEKLHLLPKKPRSQPITDAEQIHEDIEDQLAYCKCPQKYSIVKIADGKYRFGDKGKKCLVRFLNSNVMVRVGGGWVTLSKYLESNDPCKAKGRTNFDLRDRYLTSMVDGSYQVRTNSQQRRRSQAGSEHTSSSPSSPHLSSRSHQLDNNRSGSGSSTPIGRKTPTTAMTGAGMLSRSRTPDSFLNDVSPSSSVHSFSTKQHPTPKTSAAVSSRSKSVLSPATVARTPANKKHLNDTSTTTATKVKTTSATTSVTTSSSSAHRGPNQWRAAGSSRASIGGSSSSDAANSPFLDMNKRRSSLNQPPMKF